MSSDDMAHLLRSVLASSFVVVSVGLLSAACDATAGEEELESADLGATAACARGVSRYSSGVSESTDVDTMQQSRASKEASVPSNAFNARKFSRPVPLHIKMAHQFFPGNSPITGYPHEGLDYSGVGNQKASDIEGQPIHAITSGEVAFVLDGCVPGRATLMCGDGWGNQVVIDHGDNVFSRYAHITKGSILVKVGDPVRTGEKIAKIGMTGYTLGPHLHLEVGTMSNGAKVDACAPTKFSQVFSPWHTLAAVDGKAPAEQGDAPAASAPSAPSQPGNAGACAVSDPDGHPHLREGGASGPVLASVKAGTRLSVLGGSSADREVALEGWVSSTLTSCGTAASCGNEVTIADPEPARLGEASGTNLRADASTTSTLMAVVSNGVKATVLGKNQSRLRVKITGTVSASRCQ
jgi:murein DD-endopeptidase MepM/ murein hydrolase activator NlpD